MQVSQQAFNEIMKEAIKQLRLNPKRNITDIAEEVCEPYEHHFGGKNESYQILIFQVVQNLINVMR